MSYVQQPSVVLNDEFVYVTPGGILKPSKMEEMRARLMFVMGRLSIIGEVRQRRWEALSVAVGIADASMADKDFAKLVRQCLKSEIDLSEDKPVRMREYAEKRGSRLQKRTQTPEHREKLQIILFLLKGRHVNENKKGFCLNPAHKTRNATQRGLCQTCYKAAGELVKSGKLSWAKLEAAGKAKPAGKPFPKSSEVKAWLLEDDATGSVLLEQLGEDQRTLRA